VDIIERGETMAVEEREDVGKAETATERAEDTASAQVYESMARHLRERASFASLATLDPSGEMSDEQRLVMQEAAEAQRESLRPWTDRRSEPAERIAAAIDRCRRVEEDARPRTTEGLPNDIARAEGEFQAAQHVRELLEEQLPSHPSGEQGEESRGLSDEDRQRLLKIAKLVESFTLNLSEHNDAAFLRGLAATPATDTSKEEKD
jgi:hypothetical protein